MKDTPDEGRVPKEDLKSGHLESTWGHCIDALVAITGEDFGYDVEKWKAWYRINQAYKMPR